MVNSTATPASADRRSRPRLSAEHVSTLGAANLNPFGDLHTLQHLSTRLARSLRGVFEPMLRKGVRCWVEPIVVQRFADYTAEREPGLTGWVPLAMVPGNGAALLVVDGKFALEALDLFFGGTGDAPHPLPTEFSPAAETMVQRIATQIASPLRNAWEPVSRIDFAVGHVELNPAMLADLDGDDAMIVSRFGIAAEGAKPVFLDIVYPVAGLKPHGPSINAKVHGRSAEPEPKWQNGLTRAAMGVRFPVRSVLAEPTISLGRLLDLAEGDIIPISFGQYVPIMVAANRLGTGVVGTSNGKAAIRIHQLERLDEEDFQ